MRIVGCSFARAESGILYRLIENPHRMEMYVMSLNEPDLTCAEALGMRHVGTKDIGMLREAIRTGAVYRFDLLAAPAKKVARGGNNSVRVYLSSPDTRKAWLDRKAGQNGFAVEFVDEQGEQTISGCKDGNHVTNRAMRFVGVLRVTDLALFWRGYCGGIGPGKAYGLGMFLIRGM